MKTKITELLQIEHPVIGAPMFLISYPDLVAAVSNAGGLGTFPALNYRSGRELEDGLSEIFKKTSKPFGVNIVMHKGHNPNWSEQLEVCLGKKVKVFIMSLGTPREAVRKVHEAGGVVLCDVTTVRHASLCVKTGADALIAVSAGAGGHSGAISPFALIPRFCELFSTPVISAGAINSGREMAAAFSLGAEAVYLGSRLIATPEAQASQNYKQMILDSEFDDIVYTDRISGIPANWMKKSIPPDEGNAASSLNEGYKKWKNIWSAGHGVSLIHEILPAGDIIIKMMDEFKRTIQKMDQYIQE